MPQRTLEEICNSIVAPPGMTFEELLEAAKGHCRCHRRLAKSGGTMETYQGMRGALSTLQEEPTP